jgi:tetraacyldisaccharide 4'-kinase
LCSRKNGIQQFHKRKTRSLDDAAPTPKSKSWFYILLTSYGELYSDFYATHWELKKSRSGAKINIIIVTKCPANLSATDRNSIKNRLEIAGNQKLYLQILSLMNLFIQKRVRKVKILPIQINY